MSAAHQVPHRDFVKDLRFLTTQFILHQEHLVTAFNHVAVHIGDGAETSALHQQGLVIEEIGRLDHLAVTAEQDSLGKPLGHEFQAHDPVIDHREIGTRELDHVDLDSGVIEIIEQGGDKGLQILTLEKGPIDQIKPHDPECLLLFEIGLIQHPNMQDDVVRRGAWRTLEPNSHPSVRLVLGLVGTGCHGISNGKEGAFRPDLLIESLD